MTEILNPIEVTSVAESAHIAGGATIEGAACNEAQLLDDACFGLNGSEPLRSDLEEYIVEGRFGEMFDHPLHREVIYKPERAGVINRIITEKERSLEEAWTENDMGSFVFWHDRPYRIDALRTAILEHGIEKLWPLVGNVWTDTNSVSHHLFEWHEIWQQAYGPRGGRGHSLMVMSAKDRRAYKSLPETLLVYRGSGDENDAYAFSWTLDEKVAKWFAKRNRNDDENPYLLTARVPKDIVLAYFSSRNESEVVLWPDYVSDYIESVRQLELDECPKHYSRD